MFPISCTILVVFVFFQIPDLVSKNLTFLLARADESCSCILVTQIRLQNWLSLPCHLA